MLQPSTSVSGPQESVTQVFSVLLEYLMSPESSSMVHAQGAGCGGGEGEGEEGRGRAPLQASPGPELPLFLFF